MTSIELASTFFSNVVLKETAYLNWTIERLLQIGEHKSSPQFSPPNSRNQFKLELSPNNESFNLKHLFLNLYYNGVERKLLFRYRVSVLDANGLKHYTREYIWNYERSDYRYFMCNATNYISLDKCKEFLENGRLNVFCELQILNEKYSPKQTESFGKLSDNYQMLLESGKFSDFIVLVGDKQFHVHKTVLATRSAVFAAMFEHAETQEVKQGRVRIEDMSVEVCEAFIRYIYTGTIEGLDEYADELFVAADRYQLDHLKSVCVQSLISSLANESVSSVLLLSDMHNAQQLKSKCIEYMICNSKEVMQTEAWKHLIKTNRIDLVEELFKNATVKED